MFIVFEGPEGAGKTTQIGRLASYLCTQDYAVVTTREPGGTPLGERLREILLVADDAPGAIAEAYLMTAARAEHVRAVIRPALESGSIVICDRFSDSTLAYQGAGRGISIDALRRMQELAVDGCWPDLRILLDIDAEIGLRRRGRDGGTNRIDRESLEFHQRVAAWFRAEAAVHPQEWHVVDASPHEDEVAARIVDVVSARMAGRERARIAGMIR